MVTVDSVQESVTSDLSRVPIGKDWSELAIDDGGQIIEGNEYAVRLISRDGVIYTTPTTSLRFRDEVNAAQNPQFNIPPHDAVEDNTRSFLNGTVQFFIDGKVAFAGDIIKLDTSQKEGDDITVKTRNPGKRLVDQAVDITPDNSVLQDVMAKVIDRYNDIQAEYEDFLSSANHNGTITVGDIVKVADGNSSGTVTFSNVASDASQIEYINIKAYTDPEVTFTLQPSDPNEDSVVHQMDTLDFNDFGEWEKIEIPTLPNTSYDIEIELQNGSTLFDWVVVTSNDVTRDVTAPEINQVGDDDFLYSRSDSQLESNIIDEESQSIVYDSDLQAVRARQVGVMEEFNSFASDSDAVNGQCEFLNPGNQSFPITLTSKDQIDEGRLWVRTKAEGDDLNDDVVNGDIGVTEGTVTSTNITVGEWGWSIPAFDISNTDELSSLQLTNENDFDLLIDVCFWTWPPNTDHYNDPTFSNTVGAEQQLELPREYKKEAHVTFTVESAQDNITEATTTATMQNTSNSFATWGPAQRVTQDISFPPPANGTTVNNQYPFVGVAHQVRVDLTASGYDANSTPQRGYHSTELYEYEVDVSTNDLEILYDQNITGNRLESITELADSSTQLYRWEGNECKIFQIGSKETDVDLKNENINSSIGIEDVYTSAEVYGEDGVYSGLLEADNPPDFVDRNKEIRDVDIQTELDARRRAISFLRSNSDIEYEGSITTMPTFAPVGSMVDGSLFNHGQDMVIETVRYGKTRSNIDLGFQQKLSRKIRGLDEETTALTRSQTTQ